MSSDAIPKAKKVRVAIYSPYGTATPGAAGMRIRAIEQPRARTIPSLIKNRFSIKKFSSAMREVVEGGNRA